jgi:hypothetical protein
MNVAHVVLWGILIGGVSLDIFLTVSGKPTLSQAMRELDAESNGLFRWSILAVWLHLFVRTWPFGD